MNPAIFARVAMIVAEQLVIDVETVQAGSDLATSLGADSMDMAEILMAVEDEFQIELENGDWKPWKTVADVVLCIEGKGVAK